MAPAEGAPAAAWPSRPRLLLGSLAPAESVSAAALSSGRPVLSSLIMAPVEGAPAAASPYAAGRAVPAL